ncbi:MAG TPA: ATP-binding protein [Bacteroides sp.]|nr:ATP-binding protein [Bacteroides sp.]
MRRIYTIIPLVILVSGIAIVLYSTFKSDDAFTENLINSLSKSLEKDLTDYLNPLRDEFLGISEKYNTKWEDHMGEDSLAEYLIPSIAGTPAFGSVMLYNDKGYNFLIYRERNTYVTSLLTPDHQQTGVIWSRRLYDNTVSSTWTEVIKGQMERREFVQGIMDEIASDDESVIWTGIYQSRLLKEPVIAAAMDWTSRADSSIYICTIELPVRLIIRHLQKFSRYDNRRIFFAMNSGQLIDIPERVPDTIRTFEIEHIDGLLGTIQDSIILTLLDSWKALGGEVDMTFFQELGDEEWWIHIREFNSFERINAVGIAMTEASMKMGIIRTYSRIIITIAFLLISIILYLIASKKRKIKSPAKVPQDEKDDWQKMIQKGESQHLEFKSALRMDMNLGQVNPKLEDVIVKTIAAFSNGEGGKLIIGVADNGDILGLEPDFSSLRKQDSDYFEIHLRNILKQQFGVTFITTNLEILFPVIEAREICAITIGKGTEPAYITTVDKNGNKTERFYVRSGNSSQEIQSLKEITEYIGKRF